VAGDAFALNLCSWLLGLLATVCSCFNEHDEGDSTVHELTAAISARTDTIFVYINKATATAGSSFERRMVALSIRVHQVLAVLELMVLTAVLLHGIAPYAQFR
jgi:hypothetical protein